MKKLYILSSKAKFSIDLSMATVNFLIRNFGIKIGNYIDVSKEIMQKIGIKLINQDKYRVFVKLLYVIIFKIKTRAK